MGKGYTVTYISWDDGMLRVAGRFKTKEETDAFLNKIHQSDSGWMDEELMSLAVVNDYYYMLPR